MNCEQLRPLRRLLVGAITAALIAVIGGGSPAQAATGGRTPSHYGNPNGARHGDYVDPSAATPTCDYSRTTAARDSGEVIVPSVQSTGSITCLLGMGNAGRAVKRLQMTLNACYHDLHFVIKVRLDEDGVFGSRTREAVMIVQRHVGVSADGVYGPRTRDAMQHEGTALLPPCNWVA